MFLNRENFYFLNWNSLFVLISISYGQSVLKTMIKFLKLLLNQMSVIIIAGSSPQVHEGQNVLGDLLLTFRDNVLEKGEKTFQSIFHNPKTREMYLDGQYMF